MMVDVAPAPTLGGGNAGNATGANRSRVKEKKAKMSYIPPDLDVDQLIAETPNFERLPCISAIDGFSPEYVQGIIQEHTINNGMPLVIQHFHQRADWPFNVFNPDWVRQNHGGERVNIRDLDASDDVPMTLGHYLKNMDLLTSKFRPGSYEGYSKQRLYAKDLDCPPVWRDMLQNIIPSSTFYLSPTGDLMSSLPQAARAENMMVYFGHEGTYTPAHKEMCASLGQNIMVHTSGDGKDPGSSIWFMMCSKDRNIIAEYWLSHMGHDLEVEKHFASIKHLQEAPFTVYIHEQKLGDYILIPPLSPHQVWNRGEVTMKAAWNRTTVDTLERAITESLPKARLVCRDEQYKNKAIIHESLRTYANILRRNRSQSHDMDRARLQNDFIRLFNLFDTMMADECFSLELGTPEVDRIDTEYNVTCSFCRANIWNRFLSCKSCAVRGEDDEELYDVCMDCFARGRSCVCISNLNWVEQYDWDELKREHGWFLDIVLQIQSVISVNAPVSLDRRVRMLGRKTLARVCQEQLKVRPWVDIKKIKKKGREEEKIHQEKVYQKMKKEGALALCHVCKVRHPNWKCASCDSCGKAYCFGNLWRAFDMDPFVDILSKFNWSCPICLGICSCGHCRKRGITKPYRPQGTYLGASTKHVADPRSTESLVNFGRGNHGWLNIADDQRYPNPKRTPNQSLPYVGNHNDFGGDVCTDGHSAFGLGENSNVISDENNCFSAVNNPKRHSGPVEERLFAALKENGFGASFSSIQESSLWERPEGGENWGGSQHSVSNDDSSVFSGLDNSLTDEIPFGEPNGVENMGLGNSIFGQGYGINAGSNPFSTDNPSIMIATNNEIPENPAIIGENPPGFIDMDSPHIQDFSSTISTLSWPDEVTKQLFIEPHLLEHSRPPSVSEADSVPEEPPKSLLRRNRVESDIRGRKRAASPDSDGDWVERAKRVSKWTNPMRKTKSMPGKLRHTSQDSGGGSQDAEKEKLIPPVSSNLSNIKSGGELVSMLEDTNNGEKGDERQRSQKRQQLRPPQPKRKRGRPKANIEVLPEQEDNSLLLREMFSAGDETMGVGEGPLGTTQDSLIGKNADEQNEEEEAEALLRLRVQAAEALLSLEKAEQEGDLLNHRKEDENILRHMEGEASMLETQAEEALLRLEKEKEEDQLRQKNEGGEAFSKRNTEVSQAPAEFWEPRKEMVVVTGLTGDPTPAEDMINPREMRGLEPMSVGLIDLDGADPGLLRGESKTPVSVDKNIETTGDAELLRGESKTPVSVDKNIETTGDAESPSEKGINTNLGGELLHPPLSDVEGNGKRVGQRTAANLKCGREANERQEPQIQIAVVVNVPSKPGWRDEYTSFPPRGSSQARKKIPPTTASDLPHFPSRKSSRSQPKPSLLKRPTRTRNLDFTENRPTDSSPHVAIKSPLAKLQNECTIPPETPVLATATASQRFQISITESTEIENPQQAKNYSPVLDPLILTATPPRVHGHPRNHFGSQRKPTVAPTTFNTTPRFRISISPVQKATFSAPEYRIERRAVPSLRPPQPAPVPGHNHRHTSSHSHAVAPEDSSFIRFPSSTLSSAASSSTSSEVSRKRSKSLRATNSTKLLDENRDSNSSTVEEIEKKKEVMEVVQITTAPGKGRKDEFAGFFTDFDGQDRDDGVAGNDLGFGEWGKFGIGMDVDLDMDFDELLGEFLGKGKGEGRADCQSTSELNGVDNSVADLIES